MICMTMYSGQVPGFLSGSIVGPAGRRAVLSALLVFIDLWRPLFGVSVSTDQCG